MGKKRGKPNYLGHPVICCIEKDPKSSAIGGFKVGGCWEPEAKEMSAEMDNSVV